MVRKSSNSGNVGYTCFNCLEESSDPDTCSNCGSPIYEINFDESRIEPPKRFTYRLNVEKFPIDKVRNALEVAKNNYFQNYQVEEGGVIVISSNEIAFNKFVELLSVETTVDVNTIKNVIQIDS